MGVEIFEYQRSDRAKRLYSVIKPHLKPDMKILDIGCGNAPLCHFIYADFPKIEYLGFDSNVRPIMQCADSYLGFTWQQITYEGHIAFIQKKYDVVIHIGIDSWRYSPLWEIHLKILEKKEFQPDFALLESGFRKGYPYPFESYARAKEAYVKNGYPILNEGHFLFTVNNHHLKDRFYCLLRRQK